MSTLIGDHTINIMYDEALLTGCPYLVKAYDPGKVKISDVSNGVVRKPVYFSSKISFHMLDCKLLLSF